MKYISKKKTVNKNKNNSFTKKPYYNSFCFIKLKILFSSNSFKP